MELNTESTYFFGFAFICSKIKRRRDLKSKCLRLGDPHYGDGGSSAVPGPNIR